jgi:hypothetical protein
MRILVTGSRDWDNWGTIGQALAEATAAHPYEVVTVVHGGCPTGADDIAGTTASCTGFVVEIHEANWLEQGKDAGPIRNQKMVDAGADICLAFIKPCKKSGCREPQPHDSHGTADCVRRAELASIRIWRYRE